MEKAIPKDELVRVLDLVLRTQRRNNVTVSRPLAQSAVTHLRAQIHGSLGLRPLLELVEQGAQKSSGGQLDPYELVYVLGEVLNRQKERNVIVAHPVVVAIVASLRGRADGVLHIADTDVFEVVGEEPPMARVLEEDSFTGNSPDEDPAWIALIDTVILERAKLWQKERNENKKKK